MTEPRVLHCFGTFLPVTENWALRLLEHQTGISRFVAARTYLPSAPAPVDLRFFVRLGQTPPSSELLAKYHLARLAGISRKFWRVFLLDIERQARSANINLMHSHFANYGYRYQALAEKLGVPHIISFYGCDYENIPFIRPEWKPRYQELFKRAAMFVCEGDHGAAILASMGCPASKIRVHRLGVEPQAIEERTKFRSSGAMKLLQIASFREKKGHVDTVTAFALAKPDCPGLTLTLAGGGEPEVIKEVRRLILELGVGDCIHFTGPVSRDQAAELLREHDLFIHPSCHTADLDCEGGAPVVLLDAQATGMPVISTYHCDIPDEVRHERTGLLVNEHDNRALADAIIRFHRMDAQEYFAFSARARAHVRDNFDIATNAKGLVLAYRALVEAWRTSAV